MSNDYFDSGDYTALTNGQTARPALWNAVWTALVSAFDLLPTVLQLKRGTTRYGTDAGAANAHVVTMPHTQASLADGMEVKFKAAATNTGAATVNVDSLGVKSITRQSGATLKAGDILINKMVTLVYNSTAAAFELQNPFADVAIQAAIDSVAVLSSGSSVPVSATDASAGYAVAKILDSDGSAFVIGSPGANETLTIPIAPTFLAKTQADSPYTVLAASLRGNIIHDNSGATGETIFQLPAGAAGYVFHGEVQAAQYFQVKAADGETIRFLGSQSAAAGYVRANTIGKTITARWNGTEWVITQIAGTWLMDA